MSGIAPPETIGRLRRYRVELLWGAFALANYAAMIAWPSWETIPFHFVWISLTLVYGFRVWPARATLLLLVCVMAATGASIGFDAFRGIELWGELTEVPLMAAMFVAMVWHARRRVDAQHIAEQEARERRSMLARQERFIHDASHELRTPVTIARGHLELLRGQLGQTDEIEVALDELSRIDAITGRLLLLATVDQPDFVQPAEIELEPLLEEVFMRWSDVAPVSGGWDRSLRGGCASTPVGCAWRSMRSSRTRSSTPSRQPRSNCAPAGTAPPEWRSRCATKAVGCRRPRSRASSSALRAPTRPVPARRAGSGWDWPSSTRSSRLMGAAVR